MDARNLIGQPNQDVDRMKSGGLIRSDSFPLTAHLVAANVATGRHLIAFGQQSAGQRDAKVICYATWRIK